MYVHTMFHEKMVRKISTIISIVANEKQYIAIELNRCIHNLPWYALLSKLKFQVTSQYLRIYTLDCFTFMLHELLLFTQVW